MISKTKIKSRKERKTDNYIVDTLNELNKHSSWKSIAQAVSGSVRKYPSVNLREIDNQSSEGDTIIVPGKVLGSGNISKKIKICALRFSSTAVDKIDKIKAQRELLIEEVKKNPKAQGVKIIK